MRGTIFWTERDNPNYKDRGEACGDRDGNKFEIQITFQKKIYKGSLLVNFPPLVRADEFTGSFICLENASSQSETRVFGKFLQEGADCRFSGRWDECVGSTIVRYQFEMTLV
jgi:hypothetical protein